MTNTNATGFRKNIFSLLEQTIKYNEPVNISTKDGNAILLSEEDYNNLMSTFEICSNHELYNKILSGKNESIADCVLEDDVKW